MNPVDIKRGDSPIILGLPHTGTWLPGDVFACLTAQGQVLADTDWHVDRLYDGLLEGATSVRANFHRYLIDANRDPSGESLYPGQNTTTLVPMTTFDGETLWKSPPTQDEVEGRKLAYHAHYHAALEAEILRVRDLHGVAILYDCHSIRSQVPFLFEGVLPDFNIGTNGGTTCHSSVQEVVLDVCKQADNFSHVVNGRFKGGWTTRHYGRPDQGIHAIQMELAQSTHLASEEPPFDLDNEKADRLRVHLAKILSKLSDLAPSLKST